MKRILLAFVICFAVSASVFAADYMHDGDYVGDYVGGTGMSFFESVLSVVIALLALVGFSVWADHRDKRKHAESLQKDEAAQYRFQEVTFKTRLAAEQGDRNAQAQLGWDYERGWCAPRDYVKAHMWYSLAASQGDRDVMENLDCIAKQMTAEQISQAQEMADNWKPLKRNFV